MSDRVTLKIPRPIYEKLQTLIQDSGFRSVNELVVFVLRELLAERATEDAAPLNAAEIERIRRHLANLGCLDKR